MNQEPTGPDVVEALRIADCGNRECRDPACEIYRIAADFIDRVTRRADDLREFADHKTWCRTGYSHRAKCDCGLADLLLADDSR